MMLSPGWGSRGFLHFFFNPFVFSGKDMYISILKKIVFVPEMQGLLYL